MAYMNRMRLLKVGRFMKIDEGEMCYMTGPALVKRIDELMEDHINSIYTVSTILSCNSCCHDCEDFIKPSTKTKDVEEDDEAQKAGVMIMFDRRFVTLCVNCIL